MLRAHRLRWTEGNVWVLDLDKDPLPRVLIPNFYVVSETFGNNRVQAKLLLNGGVLAPREVRETENYTNYIWRGRTFGRYEDLPPPGQGGAGIIPNNPAQGTEPASSTRFKSSPQANPSA